MKSQLIDASRQHDTLTANGAITNSTSLNNCVDMFFLAGASRNMSESDIITLFEKAYSEDQDQAFKLLFWARDARGGAGEKRFFQLIARHVALEYPKQWDALAIHIPKFGYWKDVFAIEQPTINCLNWLAVNHFDDNLLGKWFPRKGKWFVAMHKYLGITPKQLRAKLVGMSSTVENDMCKSNWKNIEYSKVPSIAMNKYRNTFSKRDGIRFNAFNEAVIDGKAKVNASVLFPHLLYQAINNGEDTTAVQAQWQSLPNYMEDSDERIIPVCDVSGSMYGLPMDVSVALGLYIAERNESIFKDAFLTFSETPTMEYVTGDTLATKMASIHDAHWGMSTNLIATFELILDKALEFQVPANQMPTKLLIISDMEFDSCAENTNLDTIIERFEDSDYVLPEIIFWNVNGRLRNVPAKANQPGVGLVSGFSPAILKAILKGKGFSPAELMLNTINVERYACIKAH